MKASKRVAKPRNPLHDHPLMRKGGVHEKSDKVKRKAEKQKLKREWGCLMAFTECYLTTSFKCTGSLMTKRLTVDQEDEGLTPF